MLSIPVASKSSMSFAILVGSEVREAARVKTLGPVQESFLKMVNEKIPVIIVGSEEPVTVGSEEDIFEVQMPAWVRN